MSPPTNSPRVAAESLCASPDPLCPWRMAQQTGLAIAWSRCRQRPQIRHVAMAVSNRTQDLSISFGELSQSHRIKRGVSCCSHRSLDEARVFAMPCSGQCPNVGMVEDSQGSTWPARLARTLPAINWAIEQRHDAKGAEYTKKMKPGFRGRDLGFANWWNCRVLDYWSLPTVSSVETGLR
jgi:hypothetical protein